ncbi:MAG: pyridoxal phosphate-dependent aminotransferase, partial [Cellulomonadaceae bacterium]
MPAPAARLARIGASQIREISELAWNTPGTVVLSLGEPDLATSPHILRASQDALERDDTRYTPNAGIAPLREAIADWHRVRGNTHVTADRVWVTAGGAEAILLACVLTLDVGDEVLVPDPGYPPFAMAAQVADAQVVPYPLRVEDGFIPDPDVVDALITDRTRLLVLNTPSNPLGTVLEAEHLAALLDVARRHDLWVLSDECYAGFTYDTP